jgi:hypothetical protein
LSFAETARWKRCVPRSGSYKFVFRRDCALEATPMGARLLTRAALFGYTNRSSHHIRFKEQLNETITSRRIHGEDGTK